MCLVFQANIKPFKRNQYKLPPEFCSWLGNDNCHFEPVTSASSATAILIQQAQQVQLQNRYLLQDQHQQGQWWVRSGGQWRLPNGYLSASNVFNRSEPRGLRDWGRLLIVRGLRWCYTVQVAHAATGSNPSRIHQTPNPFRQRPFRQRIHQTL